MCTHGNDFLVSSSFQNRRTEVHLNRDRLYTAERDRRSCAQRNERNVKMSRGIEFKRIGSGALCQTHTSNLDVFYFRRTDRSGDMTTKI